MSSSMLGMVGVMLMFPLVSAENSPADTSSNTAASSSEQHAYWIVSIIVNFISLCLQGYLFYMYWKFDILHKIGVSAFILKSLGDFIFALTYFIHHIGNIFTNGDFATTPTLCSLTTAATSVSIFSDFYADIAISYTAFLTVKASTSQREVWVTPTRMFIGAFIAAIIGLMWFLLMYYDGSAGLYYGLYCFCNSWAHFSSGGILFIATATGIGVMAFNYFRLYLFVKVNTMKNDKVDISVKVALRGIMLILVQMLTWFPLLISTIINIAQVSPNIPFEMFAGWSVKVNILVGSLITLSFIHSFANKLKNDSRSASTTQGPPPPISSMDRDSVKEFRMSMGARSPQTLSMDSKQPISPTMRAVTSSVTMMTSVRV